MTGSMDYCSWVNFKSLFLCFGGLKFKIILQKLSLGDLLQYSLKMRSVENYVTRGALPVSNRYQYKKQWNSGEWFGATWPSCLCKPCVLLNLNLITGKQTVYSMIMMSGERSVIGTEGTSLMMSFIWLPREKRYFFVSYYFPRFWTGMSVGA